MNGSKIRKAAAAIAAVAFFILQYRKVRTYTLQAMSVLHFVDYERLRRIASIGSVVTHPQNRTKMLTHFSPVFSCWGVAPNPKNENLGTWNMEHKGGCRSDPPYSETVSFSPFGFRRSPRWGQLKPSGTD